MWRIIAVLALAQIGAGAIFDLGDYILDTDSYQVTGETEGNIAVWESINGSGGASAVGKERVNITEYVDSGYEPVTKPYHGYAAINDKGKASFIGLMDNSTYINIVIPFDDRYYLHQMNVSRKEDFIENRSQDIIKALS